MRSIHSILNQAESISTKKDREDLISQLKKTSGGLIALEVIQYALDPFKTFGISTRKVSKLQPGLDGDFVVRWPQLKEFLDELAARKVTGNEARSRFEEWRGIHSVKPIIERVISKNLRAGLGSSTINSIIPGAIPSFDVCLAKQYSSKRASFPKWAEPKIDGIRALAVCKSNGSVTIYSRQGKVLTNFPNITKSLTELGIRDKVLDGEVSGVTYDSVMNVAMRKTGLNDRHLTFVVFDILSVDEFESKDCKTPLSERRTNLLSQVLGNHLPKSGFIDVIPGKLVTSDQEMDEYYLECIQKGFEGIMIKDPESVYEFKRTNNWQKLKPEETYDGTIVGFYEGAGRLEGSLGGIRLEIDGVVTEIGSGFSDDLRQSIWNNQNTFLGKWVEVVGQEKTKSGAIRFPRFKRFREDRD